MRYVFLVFLLSIFFCLSLGYPSANLIYTKTDGIIFLKKAQKGYEEGSLSFSDRKLDIKKERL